jgi:hypothetical protein
VELNDTVVTAASSKIKMLFIDDSVLTLGEKTRMKVQEYVHSKETRGKSVFNLIDGKMRSVVGKTKFEVHTPTVVAAARGTVIQFEVGLVRGKTFSKILCEEGIVDITSKVAAYPGSAVLNAGMEITVVDGEPFQAPVPAAQDEIQQLKLLLSNTGTEITVPRPEQLTPSILSGSPASPLGKSAVAKHADNQSQEASVPIAVAVTDIQILNLSQFINGSILPPPVQAPPVININVNVK